MSTLLSRLAAPTVPTPRGHGWAALTWMGRMRDQTAPRDGCGIKRSFAAALREGLADGTVEVEIVATAAGAATANVVRPSLS